MATHPNDPTPDHEVDLSVHRDLRRVREQLTCFQAITAALGAALHYETVVEVIVGQGREALSATIGSIWLIAPDRGTVRLIGSRGLPAAIIQQFQCIPLGADLPLASVCRSGAPQFLHSLDEYRARYPELVATVQPLSGTEAFAILPLLLGERIIGALSFGFTQSHQWTMDDQSFLGALAYQCGLALERARLYTEAEAALTARNEFLLVAAHELKTPVTAMLSYSQLIQRRLHRLGLADEGALRPLTVLVDQAHRLTRLIRTLFDFSRMATGTLELELTPLDFTALVQQMVEELQASVLSHTITCTCPSAPIIVLGDPPRLEQIIQNLIQNAIKYSPGAPLIMVEVTQEQSSACFRVRDNGIGIPPDALPHLFERFYRAPNSNTAHAAGMGIGLYVVNEIVQRHGGRVTVESTPGAGSTFTVELPIENR